MKLDKTSRAQTIWLLLILAPACNDVDVAQEPREVESTNQGLEVSCPFVQPDKQVEWSEPNPINVYSTDDYNPAEAVSYGSLFCSGFVLDLHNPNRWFARDIFVEAGGETQDNPAGQLLYGEQETCKLRALALDVWGYADGTWTPLLSKMASGGLLQDNSSQGAGTYCSLGLGFGTVSDVAGSVTEQGIEGALGSYETYRIVAHVTNGNGLTYPFRAVLY